MNQITKPAPLGRGLSALFGDADSSYRAQPLTRGDKSTGARTLPVAWLQPGIYQPRRNFDEPSIAELAESIRERGILQPLLVRPVPEAKDLFEIIAGERRWRASQLAGLHEVPVIVRELTDREALEFGLIENVQRQDLSPLEEAEGYRRLMDEFRHTQDDLGKIVGKSRSHIANMMRLLTLPPAVKQMIEKGELSAGHARTLVTAKDSLQLALEIVKKGLNVRQAEALAKQLAENPQIHKKKNAAAADANIAVLEKELERATGLKTSIVTKGSAGTVTLHYQNLEQMDAIIKKLRG
jgi:ParB family chromosome partitioning protein